ncbi:hypothetical protein AAA090_10810 [Segatella copri]|uniref:hypothetical protein n=1 Tax=Segatella copri TaxID=165179 RepID=UPI0032C03781
MENNNITKQEVLKFSAEMEEEASVKMAIANVCGVNATDIRIVMGGCDTISEKIKNKMITPEILYAMDKAIISILINKDLRMPGMVRPGNMKETSKEKPDSGITAMK